MTIRFCTMTAPTAVLFIAATTLAQTPLGTIFTYQGHLKNAGSPPTGSFNMVFTLWNDPTLSAPANQVGPTLIFDGVGGNQPQVTVTDGLFTVPLDFAAGAFDGNRRWLEISVSGTTLTPRQEVTAAPYALKSKAALALDAPDGNPLNAVVVDNAGKVGIGTPSPTQALEVLGQVKSRGAFSQAGTGALTYVSNTGYIYIGAESGSSSNGASMSLAGPSDTFTAVPGGIRFNTSGSNNPTVITSAGKVGIGMTNPTQALEVLGQVKSRGAFGQDWTGALTYPNDLGYMYIGAESGSSTNGAAISLAGPQDTLSGVPGGIRFNSAGASPAMVVTSGGNVGICTSTPEARLHVFDGSAGTVSASSSASAVFERSGSNYLQLLAPDGVERGIAFGDPTHGFDGGIYYDGGGVNANALNFRTGGNSTRMLIDVSGNVGIGTSSPTGKLHVSAPAGDASVVLPTNSIAKAEMLDEPGIAARNREAYNVVLHDNSPVTLASRTITPPADGYVVVLATLKATNLDFNTTKDLSMCVTQVANLSGDEYCASESLSNPILNLNSHTVTIHTVFQVDGGSSETFHLVADSNAGADPNISTFEPRLTIMYFASAHGVVEVENP